jgi:hypothetical protein
LGLVAFDTVTNQCDMNRRSSSITPPGNSSLQGLVPSSDNASSPIAVEVFTDLGVPDKQMKYHIGAGR